MAKSWWVEDLKQSSDYSREIKQLYHFGEGEEINSARIAEALRRMAQECVWGWTVFIPVPLLERLDTSIQEIAECVRHQERSERLKPLRIVVKPGKRMKLPGWPGRTSVIPVVVQVPSPGVPSIKPKPKPEWDGSRIMSGRKHKKP